MGKSSISRNSFFKLIGGAVGISALSYFLGLRNQPHVASAEGAPDYLDAGSDFPVFRGPYLQKDAQLAAFLFPADLAALTALCDQTLNHVSNSPFEYVPLMANLLVVYADMLVSSLDERAAGVGRIPETEVGFWFLTGVMQRTATGTGPHHLAWFVPYLFVDESNAIATGREVYGFNKQAAAFDKTTDIQTPQFSADVPGFRHFASEAIAQKERLLDVHSPAAQKSQSQWNDWETARGNLVEALLPQLRTDLGEGIPAFVAQAILQNIRLVFLKQFRHTAEPRKACYQTIVEAPLQLKTFRGGGFFSQSHEMNLHSLESHPLAQKLGLKEQQVSNVGVWLKVDFVLGLGTEYQLT
jgi:hypothetical protein